MKIRKGDTVQVLSGNDKGKTGEVLEVMPKTSRVIVKGVNIRKKHVKPRKQGEEGGIIPVECSIHSSKVNVVCPKCNKAPKIELLPKIKSCSIKNPLCELACNYTILHYYCIIKLVLECEKLWQIYFQIYLQT